ncbi:iron-regulated transporter [Lentinula edodes]|uniref:iron-regulated transporter n=1 Tax=Lentinula edodes TaxID=5353 RepID=UPI001E8D58CB|nr:iron-regulated transporter [Lentinula edodes]KAH7878799.1 iron-regulated transporter [Lentinula edodes]
MYSSLSSSSSAAQPRNEDNVPPEIPSAISKRLYISHFLSTWNSRVFEFGAILYLATIYPGTLMPMSIYALARAASAILFSSAIGRYIDTANRLHVVRLSIVLQRLVVSASCIIFWALISGRHWTRNLGPGSLAILAVFASIQKLCSIMNLVSVEKDWVVVIAGQNEVALRALNAQMRRIDLICKLAGPFVIAIIHGYSAQVAVLVNLSMNLASIIVEYHTIARVYAVVPALQEPKILPPNDESSADQRAIAHNFWSHFNGVWSTLHDFSVYFHHRAFRPSFAGALLYFTVLSFSGQMVTYLLSAGYNSVHIAVARTLSVAFELSATWIAPILMSKINPIRTGMWFVNWQAMCLVAGVACFWTVQNQFVAASGLVAATILSRVGLWGFDLSVQVMVQREVEPEIRGSFSSVEAAWQNMFELCAFTSTIIFSKPEQFRWPVVMSLVAVSTAGVLYASFVRLRRGHLLHLPPCIERKTRPSRMGYETIGETSDV